MESENKKLFLTLEEVGRQDCSDLHSWGPGVRNLYILHYVVKGSGFYECEGKTYTVGQGQSFLIYPDMLIRYYPDPDDPWEYMWINFSGVEASALLAHSGFLKSNPVSPAFGGGLSELFVQTLKAFSNDSPADSCKSNGMLHLILARYLEFFPAKTAKSPYRNLEKALAYIEVNCHRTGLDINMTAQSLSISRATLYRLFKQNLGVSPNQYITELRMTKAISLLKETDISVKSIAYSVGYADQLYFSKAFKARTGLSPTEYREQFAAPEP